jgi:hypothetical protein
MSVYVNNTNNQVGVNPTYNTVNVIPDGNTFIVEVITPGPQGPQGEPGNPNLFTSSFVSTSSFNAFTSSYNTGSFTGSFTGNGSGLTNIISASYALTASYVASVDINTSSFATTGSNRFIGNQVITGSLNVTQGITGSLFGTATTASYFLTSSVTSASYAATSSYATDFIVSGTLTAQTLVVQTINSSVIYSSGSNIFGNNLSNTQKLTGSVQITGSLSINGIDYTSTSSSFDTRINNNSSSISILSSSYLASSASFNNRILSTNTGSFTGSFKGAFTGSFSGSLWNLQNSVVGHIPYFSSSQVLADSAIYQIDNGFSVAINQNGITTAAPEALYVWQPSTSSFNVISGKGNLDNYLQLNIQNTNQGVSASSDIVATANNGNEDTNYIDMGINNDNFNGPVGEGNDAYLYSTGRHLHIGNASNYPVQFFVGGFDTDADRKLQLNPNNQHELTGSFNISNILRVNNGITGSLFGTASNAISSSYALTASYASNVPLTASFAISSSQAQNAVSSSYALTASYVSNVSVTASYAINAATASYVNPLIQNLILTGSLLVSGSASFNNAVTINGTNVNLINSSSLNLTGGSGIYVTEPGIISGSIVGIGNVTAFSGSVNSRLTALETLIDGGTY